VRRCRPARKCGALAASLAAGRLAAARNEPVVVRGRRLAGALGWLARVAWCEEGARSGAAAARVRQLVALLRQLDEVLRCVVEAPAPDVAAEAELRRVCALQEAALARLGEDWRGAAAQAEAERQLRVCQEQLLVQRGGVARAAWPLWRVTCALREAERAPGFRQAIAADVRELGGEYSDENFSYGSTALAGFVRVEQRAAELQPGATWAVLGSSLGWIVFYAAALGHRCEGWEILPFLHSVAARTLRDCVPGPQHRALCALHCADMLTADLSGTGVAVLASQCWDRALRARVYAKLCAPALGLRRGACIIDYGDWLKRWSDARPAGTPRALREVARVKAPVSWNHEHTLFLYQLDHDGQSGEGPASEEQGALVVHAHW
jgi:hypothetical protein